MRQHRLESRTIRPVQSRAGRSCSGFRRIRWDKGPIDEDPSTAKHPTGRASGVVPVRLPGGGLFDGAVAAAQASRGWTHGPVFEFVRVTTDKASPKFVAPEARIAAFNQDGTTWVEQPMYTQVMFALHQVGVMAQKDPKMKDVEPFKTVLSGDRAAMAKLTVPAKHQRFERPYTELVYQPMLEVMQYLRASGYKTYFVTGGGRISYPRTQRRSTASRPSRSWGRPPTRSSGMTRTGRPL